MTSISDKFGKASDGVGYVEITTVKTARLAAATTLECFDLSNCNEDTPVYFMTYTKTVDPVTEEVTISNQTGWKALANVSSNTFTNLTLAPGYTDVGNSAGDFVELMPTSQWADDLVDGLLVSLDQDGTLKAGAVDNAAALASNVVTTAKIADSAVTSEKLNTTVAFSAISSQSIATGTQTTVTSFTELADTGSNFAGGKFTAPYDGIYNISGHAQFSDVGADNRVIAWLYFRTSAGVTKHIYRVEGVGRSGTHDTGVAINVTYPMDATDYVELQVFQESGQARTLQATTFSGFLVGRT